MTNYEKIKAADIDEIANLLQSDCEFCVCFSEPGPCSMPCNKGVKKWLESEVIDYDKKEVGRADEAASGHAL